MHLTMGEKTLLIGDDVSGLLLKYAALLGKTGGADAISLHAISGDGDEASADLLLDGGTVLMSETVHSSLPEPEHTDLEQHVGERLAAITPDLFGGVDDSAELNEET